MSESISDVLKNQQMAAALKAIVDMANTMKEIKAELSNMRAGLNQIQAAQVNIAAAAQRQ